MATARHTGRATALSLCLLLNVNGCATGPQPKPPQEDRPTTVSSKAPAPQDIEGAKDVDLFALRWIDWEEGLLPNYPSGVNRVPPIQIELKTHLSVKYVVKVFQDKAICTKRSAPREHGYITFKPGTATPTGYAGELGQCVKEPRPREGSGGIEPKCHFHSGSRMEIHGYAWPAESKDAQFAKRLSAKRVEVIRRSLEEGALPNEVARQSLSSITE
jgi:hypothetical protein